MKIHWNMQHFLNHSWHTGITTPSSVYHTLMCWFASAGNTWEPWNTVLSKKQMLLKLLIINSRILNSSMYSSTCLCTFVSPTPTPAQFILSHAMVVGQTVFYCFMVLWVKEIKSKINTVHIQSFCALLS